MDIDKAVELARSADVDGFTVQEEKPMSYDTESWHLDMSEFICGDAEADDYIRRYLKFALRSIDYGIVNAESPRGQILKQQCLAMYMMNIGGQIIENAIKNGLTIEMLGE